MFSGAQELIKGISMLDLFLPFLLPMSHAACDCIQDDWECARGELRHKHQRAQAWQRITARQLQRQQRHTKLLNTLMRKHNVTYTSVAQSGVLGGVFIFVCFKSLTFLKRVRREKKKKSHQKELDWDWKNLKMNKINHHIYKIYSVFCQRAQSPLLLLLFSSPP